MTFLPQIREELTRNLNKTMMENYNFDSKITMAVDEMQIEVTRQNHQNECAPSEDSDQPGHRPSLIRVFAVRSLVS